MIIAGAGIYSMVYFVTFFVQQVMHFDPIKTGFSFLPLSIIIVTASPAMTKLLPRYGPKPLVTIGTALLATGLLFWHFQINANSGYWDSIFPGNATHSTIAALRTRVHAGQLPANVIPHVRDLIAARSGATPTTTALHDGTALHAVAQIQAHSTDAGFLVGGIIALLAVAVALTTINARRPAGGRRNTLRASTEATSNASA
jgi:hypothetical protein